MTNKTRSLIFAILSVICYGIPLLIYAFLNKEVFFAEPTTSLTIFAVVGIIILLIFAKKIVSSICSVISPGIFFPLIAMFICFALGDFLTTLFSIFKWAFVGGVCAWYPYQIMRVYEQFAYNQDGTLNTAKGLSFKEANKRLYARLVTK